MFLDVYGFSAMVSEQLGALDELSTRIFAVQREVLKDLGDTGVPGRAFFFSDSVFLVYPASDQAGRGRALRVCIDDVCRTLMIFLSHDLPIRGGIAFGDVVSGPDLLLGAAVVRAVKYETLVNAPVVVLPLSELRRSGAEADRLKSRPSMVPLRDGGMMSAHVVAPYGRAEYRKFIYARLQETSIDGPFSVASAWQSAAMLLDSSRK